MSCLVYTDKTGLVCLMFFRTKKIRAFVAFVAFTALVALIAVLLIVWSKT
jgi:hypothetical protein